MQKFTASYFALGNILHKTQQLTLSSGFYFNKIKAIKLQSTEFNFGITDTSFLVGGLEVLTNYIRV